MLPIFILDFSTIILVIAVVFYRQRELNKFQNDMRNYDFETRFKND